MYDYQSNFTESQGRYYQSTAPLKMMNIADDEADYTFSNLPVRERRRMFQADEPRIISQYGTLPRGPMNRGISRYLGLSGSGSAEPFQDVIFGKSWSRQNQASPRRNSSFDYRPQPVFSSRAAELHSAQRTAHMEPTLTVSRQSRPIYRSTPMVIQAGDQPMIYSHSPQLMTNSSPTRVVRRMSYTTRVVPKGSETAPAVHDVWSSNQSPSSAQPLRVRVYNSDRSTLSPAYSQAPLQWAQASPVYQAYPPFGSPPAGSFTQVHRVVESPNRVYPRTIATSSHSPRRQQPTQIYVPLRPVHRRTVSAIHCPPKSITIHPTMREQQQMVPSQSSQHTDWTVPQPIRIIPTQAPTNQSRISLSGPPGRLNRRQPPPPPPHQGPMLATPSHSLPKVVNRQIPQPDEEIGVSEF